MHIINGTAPGALRLARLREVSRDARLRLKYADSIEHPRPSRGMDHYKTQGNAALTCRYFGISRQTFYRWKGGYNPRDLTSLEVRSRRPKGYEVKEPGDPDCIGVDTLAGC